MMKLSYTQVIDLLPQAIVDLGMLVSLASKVDPWLLRSARLVLLPDAPAASEAELWFSPLVQGRGYDGLVLWPEAAELLRRRLRASGSLRPAWLLTCQRHDRLSPALILEETLNYLDCLKPGDDPEHPDPARAIDAALNGAIAALTLAGDGRAVLASWAARALPRLPAGIRSRSRSAWLLALAASAHLDGRTILSGETTVDMDLDQARWMLPENPSLLPRTWIRLQREGTRLTLQQRDGREEGCIEVPRSFPLIVEITPEGAPARPVLLQRGAEVEVKVGDGSFVLRTTAGERWVAQARSSLEIYAEWFRRTHGLVVPLKDPLIDSTPVPLEHVFVVPRLRRLRGPDRLHSRSTEEPRRLQDCDLFADDQAPVVVIHGPMGCGKTTVARYLALQCLSKGPSTERIPIWIDAGSEALAQILRYGFARWKELMAQISPIDLAIPAGAIPAMVEAPAHLWILPTLDELRSKQASLLYGIVVRDSQLLPLDRFVCTTRDALLVDDADHPYGGIQHWELVPFDFAQSDELLRRIAATGVEFVDRNVLREAMTGSLTSRDFVLSPLAGRPALLEMLIAAAVHRDLPEHPVRLARLLLDAQLTNLAFTVSARTQLEVVLASMAYYEKLTYTEFAFYTFAQLEDVVRKCLGDRSVIGWDRRVISELTESGNLPKLARRLAFDAGLLSLREGSDATEEYALPDTRAVDYFAGVFLLQLYNFPFDLLLENERWWRPAFRDACVLANDGQTMRILRAMLAAAPELAGNDTAVELINSFVLLPIGGLRELVETEPTDGARYQCFMNLLAKRSDMPGLPKFLATDAPEADLVASPRDGPALPETLLGGVLLVLSWESPATNAHAHASNYEYRTIKAAIGASRYSDRFELRYQQVGHPRELPIQMSRFKPTVLHINGHANDREVLSFRAPSGWSETAETSAIARALDRAPRTLRCVLLNPCSAEQQATDIGRFVRYVIAIPGSVSTRDATTFVEAFYRALGEGSDIEDAFQLGTAFAGPFAAPQLYIEGHVWDPQPSS